ncbi:MAG: hypothetical protein E7417_01965 [Ruminococcaceae bacterium]|nr:hypothetical protein [Oscillospiraceae bacterium]
MADHDICGMSFLSQPLRSSLEVCGKEYAINTDFRVWLRIYDILQDKESSAKKLTAGIVMCFKGGVLPPSFSATVEAMSDFLFGEKTEKRDFIPQKKRKKQKKLFDFSKDSELIYASFMSDYGIDLHQEGMHWHKFLVLFKHLSKDTPFMQVLAIRSMNPADIKDAKMRKELVKKQRIYALEAPEDFAEELFRLI